jgi:LPS sulfotransferase NodH
VSDRLTGALLIATTPRSGSWLLSDFLARTGQVGVGREYFHVNYVAAMSHERGLATTRITEEYIGEILREASDAGVCFATKLHWLQINQLVDALRVIHPELAAANAMATDLIEASLPGSRYLYLSRRDKARQAISMFRAMRTERWWELDDAPTGPESTGPELTGPESAPFPDYLAIRWFEDGLRSEEAEWDRYFRVFGIVAHQVVYEDLVAQPQRVLRGVLDWLGLDQVAPPAGPSRLRRQADTETERILAEYLHIRDDLPSRPPGWQWSFQRGGFGFADRQPAADDARMVPPTAVSHLSPL